MNLDEALAVYEPEGRGGMNDIDDDFGDWLTWLKNNREGRPDVLVWLRSRKDWPDGTEAGMREAAAEIERLRREEAEIYGEARREFAAEIERLRHQLAIVTDEWNIASKAESQSHELRAEIERLRARAVKLESHIVNEGLWDKFVEKFGDEEDIRALEGVKG